MATASKQKQSCIALITVLMILAIFEVLAVAIAVLSGHSLIPIDGVIQ